MNPKIPEPTPPGAWVDSEECRACGELYSDFRPGVTWQDGVELVRSFPFADSAGPVLWAMRVIKLGHWYAKHEGCNPIEEDDDDVPF